MSTFFQFIHATFLQLQMITNAHNNSVSLFRSDYSLFLLYVFPFIYRLCSSFVIKFGAANALCICNLQLNCDICFGARLLCTAFSSNKICVTHTQNMKWWQTHNANKIHKNIDQRYFHVHFLSFLFDIAMEICNE